MDISPSFDAVRHRRGGRRCKPDGERRDKMIRVRVTTGQRDQVEARARAAGLAMADYSRAALDGEAVTVIVSRTAPPEVLQQLRIIGGNLRQALEASREGRYIRPSTETALAQAANTISAELRRLIHGSERQ